MKLILNNKIFIGRYNENGKLVIPLDNDFDKLFFRKWQNNRQNIDGTQRYKKKYIEDVSFIKTTESGVLKNCFPMLSEDEDFVELVYDLYKIINKYE